MTVKVKPAVTPRVVTEGGETAHAGDGQALCRDAGEESRRSWGKRVDYRAGGGLPGGAMTVKCKVLHAWA
jgi:hypothetical protein